MNRFIPYKQRGKLYDNYPIETQYYQENAKEYVTSLIFRKGISFFPIGIRSAAHFNHHKGNIIILRLAGSPVIADLHQMINDVL